MLLIEVRRCNQENLDITKPGLKCATNKEIDHVLDSLEVIGAITNQYLDTHEESRKAIKTLVDPIYFGVKSGLSMSTAIKLS